jgi:pyrroline-5-carboxylate reductase
MTRLAIVGAGMMGEALATGLIAAAWSPDDIVLADVDAARVERAATVLRVRATTSSRDAAASADGTLIAVKPQDAADALREVSGAVGASGLVSIVAGFRTKAIEDLVGGGASVVRAMPNTPARVGRGVTALAAGSAATAATRGLAEEIFGAVGPVMWLDE